MLKSSKNTVFPQNLNAWLSRPTVTEIDLNLERCQQVVNRLQLDPPPYTLISIAGTNGKGSTVALLATIYQQAGFKVGQCTSPHLLDYRERFQINGVWITEAALCRQFERLVRECADIPLTRFEIDTLAAYLWFAEQKPDVVIMEVGLGGRLDAVNVLSADAAIITNISLDHCDYLGNNREQIGFEKAGILRSGQIAAYAEVQAPQSLRQQAQNVGAHIAYLGEDFDLNSLNPYQLAPYWQTAHQRQNAAAVLNLVQRLQNHLNLNSSAIAQALNTAQLPGRLQWLNPHCLLDVAHNPAAAAALAHYLKQNPILGKTHALVAMLADKDIKHTLQQLENVIDNWHLAALTVPRAANLTQMQTALNFSPSKSYDSVEQAYQQLQKQLQSKDRLIIFGSFHTVAAVLSAQTAS